MNDDLDAFWQLVKIDLEDIYANFATAKQFRENGWIRPKCLEEVIALFNLPI